VADTWFTEDFTLAELKTLRCRERLADLRPANRRFDGEAEIATFAEVLALAAAENDRRRRAARGGAWRRLGVYPETKHPSYFRGLGLAMEAPLLAALAAAGYVRAGDGAYIQSFETASLRWLRPRTDLPLVQLLAGDGEPWDLAAAGDPRRFADLATAAGLAFLARHADGIGVEKDLVIRRTAAGGLGEPGRLVADAHAEGLFVHAWTFRAENAFLPAGLRLGGEAGGHGDLAAEIRAFLAAGIDGLFTDHPDIARRTVDADPAG
jgi:glycerophosphoryl diester phosphodiesterase